MPWLDINLLYSGTPVLGDLEGHHLPGGGLPLPGLYPGSMAGMLAQFGHESLLSNQMMPPNIPQHDLSSAGFEKMIRSEAAGPKSLAHFEPWSSATADEVLEAAMAGQLANLHHSLKRPSHTSYDTNSDMDFDLKPRFYFKKI